MKRASELKSAQTATLTLGDGSRSSCFGAVSVKTDKKIKTRKGYITANDTEAVEIHFFLAAGNIKPGSTEESVIITAEM